MDRDEHPDKLRYASEEDVKKQLCGWIKPLGVEVLWENRSPPPGFKTFKTGYKKTPDLLFRFNDEVVLVEVKTATHNSNVYDAFFQILDYHKDIKTVTIGTEIATVTGFAVATQYSIMGRLFSYDAKSEYEHFGLGRQYQADQGILPKNEYALTEMFTRLLWRGIKDGRDNEAFIGSLVSDLLNDGLPTPAIIASGHGKQFFMRLE